MTDVFAEHSSFKPLRTEVEHASPVHRARDLLNRIDGLLDQLTVSPVVPARSEFNARTMVRRLARERSEREKFFPENLTRDPAWPMLLELYRGRLEEEEVSLTGLSFGAGIPLSTGHRWIAGFVRSGQAQISPSKSDGRSSIVIMTDEGFERMTGYLTSIWKPTNTIF